MNVRSDFMITFTVPGEPQGKARARTFYNHAAHKISTMTPEKTVIYEAIIKQFFEINKPSGFKPIEGMVQLTVRAYYSIPKSASKKKCLEMTEGKIRPMKKPDADNVLKVIADSLNKIAYKDDTQIVDTSVQKFYSDIPRVEVEIEEIVI